MFKNWLRWKEGRQETFYYKMLLLTSSFPIPFDLYLLKYPMGSFIPKHKDTLPNGRHFRLNIILIQPKSGGVFSSSDSIFTTHRIKFFRPDIHEHEVSMIESGFRLVLSFGFKLK